MLCTDWRVVIFIGQLTRPWCTCCANVHASLTGRRQLKTNPKNRGISSNRACHLLLHLSPFSILDRPPIIFLLALSSLRSLLQSAEATCENLVKREGARENHNEETTLIRGNFPRAAAVKQTLIIPEHFAATTHSRRVFTGSRYNVKSRQNGEKKYLKKRCTRSEGKHISTPAFPLQKPSSPSPRFFHSRYVCFQPV